MSSYLTIYGVPKNEGKPIDIVSFSRSHCIYSAICDEVNVAWAGESEVYTNLNTSDLEEALKENLTTCDMFQLLWGHLIAEKFEIFLVTPDCYTIRARFPEGYKYQGVADFVMARKEVGYIPGTRTPIVEPGNLYDDLLRRDFTINAMAKDPDTGEIIDYFYGKHDITNALIRTPLDPVTTFDDDPLRILRAIRFAVTKRFTIEQTTWQAMVSYDASSVRGEDQRGADCSFHSGGKFELGLAEKDLGVIEAFCEYITIRLCIEKILNHIVYPLQIVQRTLNLWRNTDLSLGRHIILQISLYLRIMIRNYCQLY